ncbi:hypothetical protein Rcae01_00686 [Novipirellula caenicola]|uniref:Uncharacterized protein n=1 Tax=Novipirellula caenicola TaxID=1536901 RepID=A0ABP9VJ67_9BACT
MDMRCRGKRWSLIFDKNMSGKKMGYCRVVLQSGHFPAPLIFLPAGYPAFDGRRGYKNRVSRGVVSPRTALAT